MRGRRLRGLCGRAASVAVPAALLPAGAEAADEAPSHFPTAVGGRVGFGLPGGAIGLDVEMPVAPGWGVGIAVGLSALQVGCADRDILLPGYRRPGSRHLSSDHGCVRHQMDITDSDGPSPVGFEIAFLVRRVLADGKSDWSIYYGASVGRAAWDVTLLGWEVDGVASSYVAWLCFGLAHDWHALERGTLRLTTGLALPIAVPGHAIWRGIHEAFEPAASWDNGDPIGAPIPMLALSSLVGLGQPRSWAP